MQHVQSYEHADNPVCRRHDELRRVVADDPHEQGREHLHQLPVRSRSPQQQAEHVQLLVATRLVAEQFEQQRQLKPVLLSSRGRRLAVRTRAINESVLCNIHATFHTHGRRDGPTTSRTRRVGRFRVFTATIALAPSPDPTRRATRRARVRPRWRAPVPACRMRRRRAWRW